MRTLIGFTLGTITGLIILSLFAPKQTVVEYQTEVFTRTVIDEQITSIDLEELRTRIDDLDEQLYTECVEAIHRKTGDPKQGIINLVERHYEGNACRAADEALNGLW